MLASGYVIDAIPKGKRLEIILNGWRKVEVKTTYPVYVITESPDTIAQHHSVKSFQEEYWWDGNKEVKLYRFEIEDFEALKEIRRKVKTVNNFPSVLSQTLMRLKALPMHKIMIDRDGVKLLEEEGSMAFPEISYAFVELYDWYGPSPKGRRYSLYINGKLKEEGDIRDLKADVDVAECYGISCGKVRAIVKVIKEKKRSPVSIKGLIEWSKISRVLLREIAYSTIGKALTTNEAIVALRRKFLIPRVKVSIESPRTLRELVYADKGGLILFPEPGCFNNVYQVDFSSMYPSIIINYNISGETINSCEDLKTEIGHKVCFKERGIVPEALEWLVKRKEILKGIDEERAKAIKWILVASFGYLGYRNSKFGSIEAYETVTYFARKILRGAMKIAEEMGLEVIHGIVDSLILKGKGVEEFIERVSKEFKIKMKLESSFKWVCFTKSLSGFPVANRYFGKTEKGMKVKGMIRENMSNLVINFLEDSFKLLEGANSCEEAKGILKGEVRRVLRKYEERAYLGKPRDFVIFISGKPYIRSSSGLYEASLGYYGHDGDYYREQVRKAYSLLINPFQEDNLYLSATNMNINAIKSNTPSTMKAIDRFV
jgi:DNA polymerase I